jgi:hypothetical protein
MLTEQESMMLPATAGENFHQLSAPAAETLMAKRGELFGIRFACASRDPRTFYATSSSPPP